jgi:protein-disulfide isomerase
MRAFAAVIALAFCAASLQASAAAPRRHRAAHARPTAAAQTNWLNRIERTADGYRMGNPNARVKLVEYGSITCPHCAEFAAAATQGLRSHVRSGRVSFEYRPYLIFPSDPGIFLLLNCQAPGRFFETVDRLYATQRSWTGQIRAQEGRLRGMASRQLVPAVVRAGGVDQLFRQNGLSQQRIDACMGDTAALDRLVAGNNRAERQGVDSTPTFFINGRKVEVGSWAALDAMLRQP